MKTIQMAFATPVHFLKLPIILLALFFNFSFGEPLPISSNTSTVPIGEQYSPINYAVNAVDIGGHGGTETRKLLDIGGNGAGTVAPRSILQETSFATVSIDLPIGGTQGPPRRLNEIGGQTAPRSHSDIGGGGNETRRLLNSPAVAFEIGGTGSGQPMPRTIFEVESLCNLSNDCPTDGNQIIPKNIPEIGGQAVPRHLQIGGGTAGQERRILAIGGSQTAPRSVAIGGTQTAPRA